MQESRKNNITINALSVMRILLYFFIILIFLSIIGQVIKYKYGFEYAKGFVPLFYLDEEGNIPTVFSGLMLFFSAIMLAFISFHSRVNNKTHYAKWSILSLGFIYMGIDELSQIHELFTGPIRSLIGNGNLGIFYYAWIIPVILIILILFIYFFKFLLSLPIIFRKKFILAGAIYLAGAIVMEMIGGKFVEMYTKENFIYSMLATVEESFEMLGIIIFIRSLIEYASKESVNFKIQFRSI